MYFLFEENYKVSKQSQMKEQTKQVDWIVKMKNKNICLRVKNGQSGLFCSKKRKQGGGWQRMEQETDRSATFALPACHASSTADIYIFTVGLFYRGLSKDIFS